MSTTYTTNVGLGVPQLNDAGYVTTFTNTFTLLDALAVVGGLAVALTENPSASLNIKIAAGTFENGSGVRTAYAGSASQAMTANQTNYVYLTTGGVLTVNTSGFPSTACIPLAIVVAGGAAITSIGDARTTCRAVGSNLGYALLTGASFSGGVTIAAGGLSVTAGGLQIHAGDLSLDDGINIAPGVGTGSKIGTATTAKLAFWGATAVIQPASANQAAWATLTTSTLTDNTGGSATTTLAALTNVSALTDNTGGAASTTFAAIAAGASYAQADIVAIKNALAELVLQWNAQVTFNAAVKNALASLAANANNIKTDLTNGRTLTNQIRADNVTIGIQKGSA